jgi:hypothetical protein
VSDAETREQRQPIQRFADAATFGISGLGCSANIVPGSTGAATAFSNLIQ